MIFMGTPAKARVGPLPTRPSTQAKYHPDPLRATVASTLGGGHPMTTTRYCGGGLLPTPPAGLRDGSPPRARDRETAQRAASGRSLRIATSHGGDLEVRVLPPRRLDPLEVERAEAGVGEEEGALDPRGDPAAARAPADEERAIEDPAVAAQAEHAARLLVARPLQADAGVVGALEERLEVDGDAEARPGREAASAQAGGARRVEELPQVEIVVEQPLGRAGAQRRPGALAEAHEGRVAVAPILRAGARRRRARAARRRPGAGRHEEARREEHGEAAERHDGRGAERRAQRMLNGKLTR
ncbi:MAG: hypothetical protein M5U28_10815 [Sandaracinaceae bacterium]|nr:hypothetical protein [Sandaracinaceae bacterium]